MTDTNLPVPFIDQLPALKQDEEAFDKGIGSGDYVPYIILHANNGKFIGPPHTIPGGKFIMVKNQIPIDIGASIDCVPLEWRMLAMRYNASGMEREYDPESDRYATFQTKANSKIKEADGSRYYWGVEYLLYLPAIQQIATFYCNNPTQRRIAKEQIKTKMRSQQTWESKFIDPEGSDYSWWGFIVTPCDQEYEAPDSDELTRRIETFTNPELAEMPEGTEEAKDEDQER